MFSLAGWYESKASVREPSPLRPGARSDLEEPGAELALADADIPLAHMGNRESDSNTNWAKKPR